MSDIATLQPAEAGTPLSVVQLKARLAMIHQVMRDVMTKDVDFGTIPGLDKPSLYKPGAEKLCVVFRLRVPDPIVEEIAELDGGIRLRLRVPILGHDGSTLAVGVGECSSNELKYKWKSAVCDEEWNETPEDRRRKQWKKGSPPYQVKQIRTDAVDQVNTILKMGHKRAYVHGVIMATGASSIFTQDVEDVPEEMRDTADDRPAGKPPIQPPQKKSEQPANGDTISEAQAKRFYAIAKGAGFEDGGKKWLKNHYNLESDRAIPRAQYDAIVKAVQDAHGREAGAEG